MAYLSCFVFLLDTSAGVGLSDTADSILSRPKTAVIVTASALLFAGRKLFSLPEKETKRKRKQLLVAKLIVLLQAAFHVCSRRSKYVIGVLRPVNQCVAEAMFVAANWMVSLPIFFPCLQLQKQCLLLQTGWCRCQSVFNVCSCRSNVCRCKMGGVAANLLFMLAAAEAMFVAANWMLSLPICLSCLQL